MPIETTHVIKKGDVAAAGALPPEPYALRAILKIPRDRVERTPDDPQPRTVRRRTRIPGDAADISGEAVEIFTRIPVAAPHRSASEAGEDESDEAEATLEELEAAWSRRLEEEVAKAREEGIAAGKESVRAEMEAEVRNVHEAFSRDLDCLRHAWEDHLETSRIQLVELAFRIARVVLDAPLPSDLRRISQAEITDAIERMADGVPVEVNLHPVSYLRLRESGLEEQLSAVHGKLLWRSNPSLKENEWVVQSDRSAMRRLEAELLEELQRELSLRDFHAIDDDASDGTRVGSANGADGAPSTAETRGASSGANEEDALGDR